MHDDVTAAADDVTAAGDDVLVVAVARWREDALAEIYRRHAGAVFGLARRILSNTNLAEDVVQEVFMRLWNRPQRYDHGRGTLRAFLLADAHGRAVDVLRADRARRAREEREGDPAPGARPDPAEDEALLKVVASRVRDAVAGLPAGERVAIELAYFGGGTYREVARTLGEPEGTVKSRIRTGLRRLRQTLDDIGPGERDGTHA